MTKSDLVSAVADETGVTKAVAEKALESVLKNVQTALKKGDKVTLKGFGTFSAKERAARDGRNPQTGASIKIAAKTVPVFKPSSEFTL